MIARPHLFGSLLLCAPLGCGMISTTASGKEYPSRETGCAIRWENLTREEVEARYHAVGTVTTATGGSRASDLSDRTKAKIEKEACSLGGEALVLIMGTEEGLGGGASGYWVLVPKTEDPPAAGALATTPID